MKPCFMLKACNQVQLDVGFVLLILQFGQSCFDQWAGHYCFPLELMRGTGWPVPNGGKQWGEAFWSVT